MRNTRVFSLFPITHRKSPIAGAFTLPVKLHYLRNERTTSRNETINQTLLRIVNGILSSMIAYTTKISEPTALATSYERDSVDHLPNWFNKKAIRIIPVPAIPTRV